MTIEDKIRAINWLDLSEPNIPIWLIRLNSTRPAERLNASLNLLEYLHQNDDALNLFDGYKALLSTDMPVLITNIIVELAINSHTFDRFRVIEILTLLAKYQNVPSLEKSQLDRAKIIYQQILAYENYYYELMLSDDPKLRLQTIWLLDAISKDTEKFMNYFLTYLYKLRQLPIQEYEEEKIQLAGLLYETIKDTSLEDNILTKQFREILIMWISDYDETISTQATAAFYLIKLDKYNSEFYIQVLCNVLKLPSYQYLLIPGLDECFETFLELGIKQALDTLIEIFDAQTTTSILYDLAFSMLSITFAGKHCMNFDDLSDSRLQISKLDQNALLSTEQKRILVSIANNKRFWKIKKNMLPMFGLPSTQKEIQEMIR